MKIPVGDENDRTRAAFSPTNDLRFDLDITPEVIAWWDEAIRAPHGLDPSGFADALTASWDGHRARTYTSISPATGEIDLVVHGMSGDTRIWLIDRSIDLSGGAVDARRMLVSPDGQQRGIGSRLMRDTLDMARRLDLEAIRIEADDIGRYAWLRLGFVPDRGSWRSLREACVRVLSANMQHIDPTRVADLLALLSSTDPRTARVLASLDDPVTSTHLREEDGSPAHVPIGKAMFLDGGPAWFGELRLDDAEGVAMLESYVDGR